MINLFEKYDIEKIVRTNQKRVLSWEMFYNCNHRCKMCFQRYFAREKINYKELKRNCKKVNEFILKNKVETLNLLGGELTLLDVKKLSKLINIICKKTNLKLNVHTNFTADIKYYTKLEQLINKKNIKSLNFSLSFNSSLLNYDEYFKKVLSLKEQLKNTKLTLIFVTNSKNTNKTVKFLLYFKKYKRNGISLVFNRTMLTNELSQELGRDISPLFKKLKEFKKYLDSKGRIKIIYKNGDEKEFQLNDFEEGVICPNGLKCTSYKACLDANGKLTTNCRFGTYIDNLFTEKNIPIALGKKITCNGKTCMGSFDCLEKE